jgi:histidinol-phosphate aminotransferase
VSWIAALARPEIVQLKAYEHATWEIGLERMHANELPWRAPGDESTAGLNRYPEPQPRELIAALADLYGVAPACLLAGRGSDEMIDVLIRVFCRAGQDDIVICPPTFGMYAVSARIQGAGIVNVPLLLERAFALDEPAVLDACGPRVKLVFICSPNNPTGNALDETAVLRIATRLQERALLVLDEAYIEFSARQSLVRHLGQHSNLVVLRTLSKAHGLAGARCGALLANPQIIALLRKVIPPYAIPQLTTEATLRQLEPAQLAAMRARIELICSERARLASALGTCKGVRRVWDSDANFLLVDFNDATRALQGAREAGLLIRDVRAQPGLGSALRISIGTPEQNSRLIEALR